jgi:hypothetical protein
MDAQMVTGVHAATARMNIHEVARQLNNHLGPTLVAVLTGTPDRKLPIRWAKADGPVPGPAYARRLQLAHRAWTHVAGAEGDHVARAWFIGANPTLGETTPLTATRNDRSEELMLAVKALLEDTPGA